MTTGVAERLSLALADRYRVERELGQGGMATVYLAEDLKHGRKVAIKVLHPELSAIIGGDRFLTEIRTTASLQHPHILGLIDSGEADRLLYYVMPFVSGESLRARLTREKQLPVNDAIRLAKEVAGALDYAHRQGVIHRDIKPENILLQDGAALVADFGIALAVQQAGGSRMTQTGMSLGTPAYMSPEQAMGERDIGARSDVYALGAMTYEMLTGEPPFTGLNSQAIVAKVLTEAPPLIRPKRPTVGAGVEDAVLTALQKLPADRFGSAREFAEALDGTGASGRYAATVALPRATRGRRSPVMAVAAVAVVAAVAGAVGWRMRPAPVVSSPAAWQDVLSLPDSILPLEQPSLSPDGSVLAFSASSSSKIQAWLRRADASSPVPLPGSDGCMTLAFSPDGKRIACLLRQGRLVALPLNGGPAVRIADSAAIVSNATWLDDDHVVYASSSGLLRTTSTGGAVEQWTTVDTSAGERYHAVPFAVSGGRGMLFVTAPALIAGALDRLNIAWVGPKGGKHVVLMRGISAMFAPPAHLLVTQADGSIVAVPFDADAGRLTGPPVPIVSGLKASLFSSVGTGSVTSAGRLVYVRASTGRLAELVRVRPNGAVEPFDTGWTSDFRKVALSPNGRQVAVERATSIAEDVAVRDLSSGAVSHVSVPDASTRDPRFLPDGSLIFAALAPGNGRVFRMRPGSAEPMQRIAASRDLLMTPIMSPDGTLLYFTSYSGDRLDIVAHRMTDPDSVMQPVLATPADERLVGLSPDGRWMAYLSNESGQFQVYVRSTDSTRDERWVVLGTDRAGVKMPHWSRDGRTIRYVAADTMFAVSVASGPSFAMTGLRALFKLPAGFDRYDVFPDGSMLMIRARAARSELMMVDDWRALLPR